MSTATYEPVIGPEYKSDEWYALRVYDPDRKERPIVFGASDAAAACGQSPYGSPMELYLQYRGQVEKEFTEEQEEQMRLGLLFEPIILNEYEDREGCKVDRDLPMLLSPDHYFMGASLDGIARKDTEKWAVDSKSSNFRMFDNSGEDINKFGDAGTDQVPTYILMQGQQQMAVAGVDRVDFPVMIDARSIKIYRVDRNEELIQQIITAEKELAERIVNGEPPEPSWSHTGTRRLLNEMFGCKTGEVTELTVDDKALWDEAQALGLVSKDAECRIKEIKNELYWRLGDNELGRFPDSNLELKRTIVKDSVVKQSDIDKLTKTLGQVRRKGHHRLGCRKIK